MERHADAPLFDSGSPAVNTGVNASLCAADTSNSLGQTGRNTVSDHLDAGRDLPTSGARTYVAVYNGHSDNGCWMHLRMLVNHLAVSGHKVYLVLPSLHDGLVHQNIFPVVLESETAGWMGLRKIHWALRAARVARTLAARLDNAEYIAFDTHNGTCLLSARARHAFRRNILFVRAGGGRQCRRNEAFAYSVFVRLVNRRVTRCADLIVCDSERVVSQLDAINIGVPVLLSNGGGDPRLVRWRESFLFHVAGGAAELATKIAAIEQDYAWARQLPAVNCACEQAWHDAPQPTRPDSRAEPARPFAQEVPKR